MIRIARRLRRGRRCVIGRVFRRGCGNDVKHNPIVDVHVASGGAHDVPGGDVEKLVQLGIDKAWIGVVQSKLCQSLGAIHRRLSSTHSVIAQRVAKFLHLRVGWTFAGDALDLFKDLRANLCYVFARFW